MAEKFKTHSMKYLYEDSCPPRIFFASFQVLKRSLGFVSQPSFFVYDMNKRRYLINRFRLGSECIYHIENSIIDHVIVITCWLLNLSKVFVQCVWLQHGTLVNVRKQLQVLVPHLLLYLREYISCYSLLHMPKQLSYLILETCSHLCFLFLCKNKEL